MSGTTQQLSIRLPKDVFKSADELSKLEHTDRSSVLKQAIEKGLADLKLETALDKYRDNKLSISEASKLAELSVGEFMDLAVKHGIKSKLTLKDLDVEKQFAKGLFE